MKQTDIQIGGQYCVRIGNRLAPVTVLRRLDGRGRARFACLTGDTGREVRATAARLRPMVEPRQAAAPKPAAEPAAWSGPAGDRWLPAVPVPGLLRNVRGRVIKLSDANLGAVCRVVDRQHVAESLPRVARVVRDAIGRSVRWNTIPRDLRRGVVFAAACRHWRNRETYRAVTGHDPLPSERMVAEAVGVACGLGRMP